VDLDYTSDGAVQWSHSGAFALGAGTAYYLLPGSRVGVLALTNAYPVGAAEAVCLSVLDLVRNGTLTQDWLALLTPLFAAMGAPRYGTELGPGKPVVTGPALPLAAYTGTYHNAFYGPAEVAVVGGQLVLRLGPKPLEFPLTPLGRDSFTWTPVGENAFGDRSGLVFTVGPNGQASALTDDYLTSGGPGTLVRVR
jgi:hypothetical protein